MMYARQIIKNLVRFTIKNLSDFLTITTLIDVVVTTIFLANILKRSQFLFKYKSIGSQD